MKAIIHHAHTKIRKRHDTLLVTGDGRSLLTDLADVGRLGVSVDTACIGRSIQKISRPLHWFNADGETAIAWAKKVKEHTGAITHTLGPVDGFDVDWDIEQDDYQYERITGERGRLHGSSAFFAALAGIAMGYDKIILAGCPLDSAGHWYFEPTGPETLGPLWMGVDFAAWIDFSGNGDSHRVRSMSGFTSKILGKVTKKWLNA